ncbi:MAG: CoA transferase [Pseudomonadota bacterium]
MHIAPLAGIRVVELGSSIAGPFAALILAQLGAEVIKVEPPVGGDAMRTWGAPFVDGQTAAFETFNRGKKSVAVDFSDAGQMAALRRFIDAGADVVLQNLRPGVVDRFELDETTLRAANARLVYCNLGAFGRRGPLADSPGYDPLMQAFSGLIAGTGEADRDPVRVGAPIMDLSTGMWAAIGILGLLVRRAGTDVGGTVDTSLFESSLAWQSLNFATMQVTGAPPGRSGLTGPLIAPNGGFQACDGIVMIVVGTNAQFTRMCVALDVAGLAGDPRFASSNARYQHREALREVLDDAMRGESRAHWVERLNAANVPCAPLQDLAEVAGHPQTAAMGAVQQRPGTGFEVLGLPLGIDGERPAYAAPAPALGADSALLNDD